MSHNEPHDHSVARANVSSVNGGSRVARMKRPVEQAWRHRRLLLSLLFSLPAFAFAEIAAYSVRYEGLLDADTWREIWITLPWVLAAKSGVFTWFRVYQGWSRYVTFYDLIVLAQAAVASSLILVLAAYFCWPELVVPRSVFLLDGMGTLILFGALRSAWRWLHERSVTRNAGGATVRGIIVGTNDSAEMLLRAIRRNPKLSYQIVGFIAVNDALAPSRIDGLPVLGDLQQLSQIAQEQAVDEILMMADELSGREVRRIMDAGASASAQVKVLPSYEQLLHNRVDLQPRTVSIADLLRREPVKLDMRGLHGWIDGRVLLVTGSAGSIGSEICRQLAQFEPRQLVVIDRSENGQFYLQRELEQLAPHLDVRVHIADVGDRVRMDSLLRLYSPDIVFHAAAYKHVPLMEENPGEAVKNIVTATRCLADLADFHGVSSFVMISTDKAVNPTSVMGACKRVAEIYVQSLAKTSKCQFVTVRFGNVLDSAGSVVPIFREQIRRGGPVTVTHPDMQRYFMMIPEASQLVIQAGAMGQGGEIFVLNMGRPVRIVDLAREMIQLSGLEVGRDIEIEFSGMRRGEKLYEELHNSGELHAATVHPKIMVADATPVGPRESRMAVGQLEQSVNHGDFAIIRTLQSIIPQYHPQRYDIDDAAKAA